MVDATAKCTSTLISEAIGTTGCVPTLTQLARDTVRLRGTAGSGTSMRTEAPTMPSAEIRRGATRYP